MSQLSITELHERQRWPLNQKIDHACGAIEAFTAHCKEYDYSPYVSFSGGMNSTVLLDIVRRYVAQDMKGVFCSTGNEYPEIIQFVRQTRNVETIHPEMTPREVLMHYGFPLVSKEQAQAVRQIRTTCSEKLRNLRLYGSEGRHAGMLSKRWRYLVQEPYMVSERCCDILKKRPFHKYNRKNRSLPMLGTMASESRLREMAYVRKGGCNVFTADPSKVRSAPLSIWMAEDCRAYIHRFGVPYASIYDVAGVLRTGCMCCGFGAQFSSDRRFEMLYERHPRIYQMIMEYTNNGCSYRGALQRMGVRLPDEYN